MKKPKDKTQEFISGERRYFDRFRVEREHFFKLLDEAIAQESGLTTLEEWKWKQKSYNIPKMTFAWVAYNCQMWCAEGITQSHIAEEIRLQRPQASGLKSRLDELMLSEQETQRFVRAVTKRFFNYLFWETASNIFEEREALYWFMRLHAAYPVHKKALWFILS